MIYDTPLPRNPWYVAVAAILTVASYVKSLSKDPVIDRSGLPIAQSAGSCCWCVYMCVYVYVYVYIYIYR